MKDSKETTPSRYKESRVQRGIDLNGLLGSNKHLFSLKDVCEEAGLNYKSTSNAINSLTKKKDIHAISDDRLELLEETAIKLSESKVETETV